MRGNIWIELGMRRKLGSGRRGGIRSLASEIPVDMLRAQGCLLPLCSFPVGDGILLLFIQTKFSLGVSKKVVLRLIMGRQRWRSNSNFSLSGCVTQASLLPSLGP